MLSQAFPLPTLSNLGIPASLEDPASTVRGREMRSNVSRESPLARRRERGKSVHDFLQPIVELVWLKAETQSDLLEELTLAAPDRVIRGGQA